MKKKGLKEAMVNQEEILIEEMGTLTERPWREATGQSPERIKWGCDGTKQQKIRTVQVAPRSMPVKEYGKEGKNEKELFSIDRSFAWLTVCWNLLGFCIRHR